MSSQKGNNSGGGSATKAVESQDRQLRLSLEKELEELNKQISSGGNISNESKLKKSNLARAENELQLLEQRMILYLKLKLWNELIEEGYRILGKKGPSVIVYKSVLVGLCRVGRYDEDLTELLNHWKRATPKDIQMQDTSQKMSYYLNAIRSGVNPSDLFTNLEEALGLNAEWVTNRKVTPSQFNWKHRPPPKLQNTFYLCPRAMNNISGVSSCIYGDKCLSAHSKEELEEWKRRHELKTNNKTTEENVNDARYSAVVAYTPKPLEKPRISAYTILPSTLHYYRLPTHALHYLRDIVKKLDETTDLRNLIADQLTDVKFVCNTDLKISRTIPKGSVAEFPICKWAFLIGSRQPVRTVCLLHDAARDYYSLTSAFFINSAGKNLNLIEVHETNKLQRGRIQVLNTFVPQNMLQLLGGWPEWFYYKIELTFSYPQPPTMQHPVHGSFLQTIMFDFKSDPKLVKHLAVEVIPAQSPIGTLPSQLNTHASSSAHIDNLKMTRTILPHTPAILSGATTAEPITKPAETVAVPCNNLAVATRKSSFDTCGVISLWNTDLFDLVDSEAGISLNRTQNFSSDSFKFGELEAGPNGSNVEEFSLSRENYVQVMARLLSLEMKVHQARVSKLNITTSLELTSSYTIERNSESFNKFSYSGQLYGRLELNSNAAEDSLLMQTSRFILRNCNSVYLAPLDKLFGSPTKPRVYICKIADKFKSSIIISIGPRAVSELNIQKGSSMKFHIQFQLDTSYFRTLKGALEMVGETQLGSLFPNFENIGDWVTFPKESIGLFYEGDVTLNMKQMEAYNVITYNGIKDGKHIPPALIIGPFGTGKTHTLAQSLKKLLLAPVSGRNTNRILICTSSNSGADIYITNFIHPWIKDEELHKSTVKPLRIYFAGVPVQTVSAVVKQFCLFNNDGQNFRCPSKEEVLSHNVVIVTLSAVMEMVHLGLDEDTFSHIFIDEAAQCLEIEALLPLVFCGRQTRVILAGDHMQLRPEVFGIKDVTRTVSLLERLNSSYPIGHPCRLVFTENYRSHNAILKYAGERFYNPQLRCASIQPIHPLFYPLTFFAVNSGEEQQSADGNSYYNLAEVYEIVERIATLLKTWPPQWEKPSERNNAVAVLTTQAEQANRLQIELNRRGFAFVHVDLVSNIQGKQFRVVFLSTVRKLAKVFQGDTSVIGQGEDTEFSFYNNPKMFNTVITRAQSLVCVVGDPLSLCAVGICGKLWQDFIQIAFENKSLYGIKENILETHKIFKKQTVPLSNTSSNDEPLLSLMDPSLITQNIIPANIKPLISDQTIQPQSNSHMVLNSKAVGSKLTKSFSEGDDDFLDKILNTASSNLSPFASIWNGISEKEDKPTVWSNAIDSSVTPVPKITSSLDTFNYHLSGSLLSTIWSSDSDRRQATSPVSSETLLSNISSPLEETKGSNNLDFNNFGLSKNMYYNHSNKSSFEVNINSSAYQNNVAQDLFKEFPENIAGVNAEFINDENYSRAIAQPPVSYPVTKSESQPTHKTAAASLMEQIKALTGGSTTKSVNPASSNVETIKNDIEPLVTPNVTASPGEQRDTTSTLFSHSPGAYGASGHHIKKPFNYELPPRMIRRQAETAAVPYETLLYGRSYQNFKSSFDVYSMNSLFQQNTQNNLDDIATLEQQQIVNIKAAVHSAVNNQADNSSSASSTCSTMDATSKCVDKNEFPSLYEVESKKTVGTSEWIEVKKSKKASKAQQQSEGRETSLTTEKKIDTLQKMGFDKKKAIRALQNCDKDLERAVEWLLAGGVASVGKTGGENQPFCQFAKESASVTDKAIK